MMTPLCIITPAFTGVRCGVEIGKYGAEVA